MVGSEGAVGVYIARTLPPLSPTVLTAGKMRRRKTGEPASLNHGKIFSTHASTLCWILYFASPVLSAHAPLASIHAHKIHPRTRGIVSLQVLRTKLRGRFSGERFDREGPLFRSQSFRSKVCRFNIWRADGLSVEDTTRRATEPHESIRFDDDVSW